MMLFKAFTPYLGYVGGFVAWSWSAVKGFDKGHGVTLSATWLLTAAVVPGTWEKDDIPDPEVIAPKAKEDASEKSTQTAEKGGEVSKPPPLPPRSGLNDHSKKT